ncbi:MAG: MBL fold metallo-hydrolase [Trueperaceae bacterium]|nr:MBL fold metallo-hydrolase [Trueperaceae bacterium]
MRAARALLLGALLSVLSLAAALELTFLDVGQGLSVLIRSPSGQVVLYDAGPASADVAQRLQALGVDRIDLLIASHAHSDHIGGMADVLRTFRPPNYLDNGLPHTTATFERTLQAAIDVDVALLSPERRRIGLGEATLHVVPPPGDEGMGHNANSVGLVVSYGTFRATLVGDAEPAQWAWWGSRHGDLLSDVDVHGAAHHGSRNGDTRQALARLTPAVVVISSGRDNRYGHPHAEALRRYRGVGAEVYRTDLHGRVTVQVRPDGTYTVEPERRADAPALAEESAGAACIDVNNASPTRLTEIVHIGPSRAEDLVRERERRAFARLADLTRVDGIAEGRLRDIRDQGVACVP